MPQSQNRSTNGNRVIGLGDSASKGDTCHFSRVEDTKLAKVALQIPLISHGFIWEHEGRSGLC